jgi:hypothetical protein
MATCQRLDEIMRLVGLISVIAVSMFVPRPTFAADIVIGSGVTVGPGESAALPVSLALPAACCGLFIQLASSDNSVATVSPASLFIPQGATQPLVPPQVAGQNFGTVTITASALGLTSASQTVTVGGSLSFTPGTLTMQQGASEFVFVSLSAPAPASQTIALASDNPSIATVPPSIVIPANWSSSGFQVTGVGAGSTVIRSSPPANITSASLNVTVMAPATINLPPTTTLSMGQSVAFPVTLGSPAPAGGITVTLSSSDTATVTVSPSSIFIAGGSVSPSAQPQITAVDIGSTNINASADGYGPASGTAVVSATFTFSLPNLTVAEGTTQNVTIVLSTVAPPAGFFAKLTSDNPAVAIVPGLVGFHPDGSSVSSSTIGVTGVGPGTTLVHASALPFIPDTAIPVTVVVPGMISIPGNVSLGVTQSVPFPVQLGTPAPAGGVTVTLLSSDQATAIVSPSPVFIAAGSTTPATQPQLTGEAAGNATITASAIGYSPASATVSVVGGAPSNVSATGGTPQSAVVASPFAAPFSATVTDAKGKPLSGVTVTFRAPANGPSGLFAGGLGTVTATTDANGVATSPVFTANGIPGSYTASALVQGVGVPAVFLLTNTIPTVGPIVLPGNVTLAPNQSAAFPVTLGLPAPTGGMTITLTSSDPTIVSISPSSVFIAAGATAPIIQPIVMGGNFGSANISASATGIAAANQLVQVNGTMGFTPSNLTVGVTATGNLTLNLSGGQGPSGGLTVNITSSNTGVATVPSSVVFPPNGTSVTVPVTGVSVGSASITAHSSTPNNLPDTTANVSVKQTADIILASGVTVSVGKSMPLNVSLAQPAAGFIFISLSSNDPSKLTITPSSVAFFQGSTTPLSQPVITGLDLGSVKVTASGFNLSSDTETVQVVANLGFGSNALTIGQASSQQVSLTLSAPLATAQTVTLTSDNTNVVTVPPSVTIQPNSTSVSFAATGVNAGSTMIHASSSNPNLTPAATGVTVVAQNSISLPSNIALPPNGSAPFAVSLGAAAPAGGVAVTLSSSDPTIVSVSPASVVISGGATTPAAQPQVTGGKVGSATITASAPGYTTASQSVSVAAGLNFSTQNLTLIAGSTQTVQVILSAPSPGGFFASVTSDNPSVASAPPYLVFFPNGSSNESIPLTITAGSPGTTKIQVVPPSLLSITGATITVTVVSGP